MPPKTATYQELKETYNNLYANRTSNESFDAAFYCELDKAGWTLQEYYAECDKEDLAHYLNLEGN